MKFIFLIVLEMCKRKETFTQKEEDKKAPTEEARAEVRTEKVSDGKTCKHE